MNRRILAAVIAIACLGFLGYAAVLRPDPAGFGTHLQMGLGDCPWRISRGYYCPTCGMTTAVSLAAHGHIIDAFVVQPAGALLAVIVAMTVWIAGYAAATGFPAGRWLGRFLRPVPTAAAAIAVVGAAWGYKLMMG
jgi:hypothetical protein